MPSLAAFSEVIFRTASSSRSKPPLADVDAEHAREGAEVARVRVAAAQRALDRDTPSRRSRSSTTAAPGPGSCPSRCDGRRPWGPSRLLRSADRRGRRAGRAAGSCPCDFAAMTRSIVSPSKWPVAADRACGTSRRRRPCNGCTSRGCPRGCPSSAARAASGP